MVKFRFNILDSELVVIKKVNDKHTFSQFF